MSSNTFMYFLNRECKLSLRYHTPFSLLIASILRIETSDSTFEIPATDQHPRLILKVVSTLKQKLREIDMIGVSSTAAESIIFAILPMTEETKTYGLAERLRHEFAALTLETNGRMAHLNLALSISGFDAAAMDGRTVFLKAAMAHHRAAEKILLAGIPQ
jgi:GGDEF domain-containing protein